MSTATLKSYTIFEVLEYGPIVAWDKETGTIITVSKICFSYWTCTNNGHFIGGNTCLITDLKKVGNCTDFGLVCEVADEWMQEILDGEDEEETSQ